jgi:inosine-uridine nucleoside N-ribohydrolase
MKWMLMSKILIDTDPGIDDAMAILLAAASPELEIVGVTTVFGNNPDVPLLTRNALGLLHLAGRDDVPVAQGALGALRQLREPSGKDVHGDNGLGGAPLDDSPRRAETAPADQCIVDLCRRHRDALTLVTLAPLTNIANALAIDPHLATMTPKLSMMGGAAMRPGNTTPTAEANILNDPEAARITFNAGFDITMAGLDVTHKAWVSGDYIDALCDLGNRAGNFLHAACQSYLKLYLQWGEEGLVMHDVHAIMVLLRPDIYQFRRVYMDVETEGELTRGMTVPDWRNQWQDKTPQTTVLLDVDADEFRREFIQRIAKLP